MDSTSAFSHEGFMPHGYCLLWQPGLLWSSAAFDILITLSYYSIPLALVYFVRKRTDFEYRWILILFAAFILLCGTTHLLGAILLWKPLYYLDVAVKAATALVSVFTAVVMWPLIPKLLALPSQKQLELANAALHESEERFRLLLDNAPMLVWMSGTDAKCFYFSKPWLTFTGRTLEQEMGDGWAEGVHADDLKKCLAIYLDAFKSRTPFTMDYRLRRFDGAYRWILDSGVPRFAPDGNFAGYIGSCVDITERKEGEARILEAMTEKNLSEGRLLTLINTMEDVVYFKDGEGRWLIVNDSGLKLFGLENVDYRGKRDSELVPPSDFHYPALCYCEQTDKKAWEVEGSSRMVEKIPQPDGSLLLFDVIKAPLFHDNGGRRGLVIFGHDITERVKAEQAVRESEELMRLTFDNATSGMALVSLDGKFARVNAALCQMYGYGEQELVGKPFQEITHPDDLNIGMEWLSTVARGETEKLEIEKRYIRKDGGVIWCSVVASVIKDARGKPLHLFSHIIDVTARKEAEKTIHLMSLFPKFNPGPIIRCDANGVIQMANPAALAVFRAEDLQGAKIQAILPGLNAVDLTSIIRGGSLIFITTAVNKGYFQFAIKGVAELGALNIYGSDISAIKEAEQNVRAAELRYRTFFEQSPFGVALIDMETALPVEFNDLACQQLGYTRGEFARLRIGDYEAKESPEETVMHVAKVLREGGDVFETKHRAKGGEVRDMLVIVKFITLDGKAMLFGIFQDITERKAAEEKLKAAKEAAEEATRLKDKFVSLVSHDLKTPLASMIGFLKLVRYDYAEPLNDGAKMILDRAVDSGEAMVHLIDDLLTISRFKTGQLKLHRQFFDAEYLGVMMTANYSHLARQKGIEIGNTIPAYSRIYGDKTLLTEAVQNLVTNAIKFCKSGDHITISLAEGDAPVIRVRDTGPGIKPNFMNDLFKFEKKTSTTGTAGETGTGFGLPLVKNIMELHGGELEIKSDPGKGCLFSLNLPYVRPKILIVDDDRSFRVLQIMQLRELNADIIEAENGVDALNMMAGVRPDLVITDIQMPVMDGLELLKRIKGAPETRDIPVIVQSGEFGMEIRDAIFKFGGDDFITKNKTDKIDLFPRVRRFIG